MKTILALLAVMLVHSYHVQSAPFKTTTLYTGNRQVIAEPELFSINLHAVNSDGTISLQDGNMTLFDPTFNNEVDLDDFKKLNNFAENLGIVRGNFTLAIERRQPLNETDTIFLRMWQMRQMAYQLELIPGNMAHPGMAGYLEDSYLHTLTPIALDDTTIVGFTITGDTASANQRRFRVIFKTKTVAVDTVNICSFKATRQDRHILVEWKANRENHIKNYVLERSGDGHQFSPLVSRTPVNNKHDNSAYQYVDNEAVPGDNYYRIKNNYSNGKVAYSQVLKLSLISNTDGLSIFPNPVSGNNFCIQLKDMPAGNYQLKLVNNWGRVMTTKRISHTGGAAVTRIETGETFTNGVYHVEVADKNGRLKTIRVLVLHE